MCISPRSKNRSVDLTTDDLRAIVKSIETQSAFWRIRATYAPSPHSRRGGIRWAYLFWAGPPSDDSVPTMAITRHVAGYTITVLDALELFASGAFEMMECTDLGNSVEALGAIISEAQEIALDRAEPDLTTFASCLANLRGKPDEAKSQDIKTLHEVILDSMPNDVQHS